LGSEQVLLKLVGNDAIPGFFVGESGKRLGVRRHGGGHGVDNRIDLFLGKLRERRTSLLRAPR